jgi:hypothetical protein
MIRNTWECFRRCVGEMNGMVVRYVAYLLHVFLAKQSGVYTGLNASRV